MLALHSAHHAKTLLIQAPILGESVKVDACNEVHCTLLNPHVKLFGRLCAMSESASKTIMTLSAQVEISNHYC